MKIDVYQDTVCPWCRIGRAHLLAALESLDIGPVEVEYKAFLLDPTTPKEGRPRAVLIEKLGGKARSEEIHSRVCEVGEACGLDFRFEDIERIPNTMLSHQLVKLTPHDKQGEMVEALHDAYFQNGRDIGELDVLLDVAEEQGLDREGVRRSLLSEERLREVEADLQFAAAAGISGVPFFVVNDKYGLSGAQPVEVFVEALQQIASET